MADLIVWNLMMREGVGTGPAGRDGWAGFLALSRGFAILRYAPRR